MFQIRVAPPHHEWHESASYSMNIESRLSISSSVSSMVFIIWGAHCWGYKCLQKLVKNKVCCYCDLHGVHKTAPVVESGTISHSGFIAPHLSHFMYVYDMRMILSVLGVRELWHVVFVEECYAPVVIVVFGYGIVVFFGEHL